LFGGCETNGGGRDRLIRCRATRANHLEEKVSAKEEPRESQGRKSLGMRTGWGGSWRNRWHESFSQHEILGVVSILPCIKWRIHLGSLSIVHV
jgi:hypothetical protein